MSSNPFWIFVQLTEPAVIFAYLTLTHDTPPPPNQSNVYTCVFKIQCLNIFKFKCPLALNSEKKIDDIVLHKLQF